MNKITQTKRMTASDFDQELLDLYDFYAHGKITKREFLDRAGKFAVGGLTAITLLSMLSPNYALAQQVAEDDGRYRGRGHHLRQPERQRRCERLSGQASGRRKNPGAVLVVHENRGLNPYIRDVARPCRKGGVSWRLRPMG